MPLEWDEVNETLDPKNFTIKNAIERIERERTDPVAAVLELKPDLPGVLDRLARKWTNDASAPVE
jgi:DNA primase